MLNYLVVQGLPFHPPASFQWEVSMPIYLSDLSRTCQSSLVDMERDKTQADVLGRTSSIWNLIMILHSLIYVYGTPC